MLLSTYDILLRIPRALKLFSFTDDKRNKHFRASTNRQMTNFKVKTSSAILHNHEQMLNKDYGVNYARESFNRGFNDVFLIYD